MRDAADGKDKPLFETRKAGGSPQAEAGGDPRRARPREAAHQARRDGRGASRLPQPAAAPSYASPVSSSLPRYQGPPAVVSVDAKHVRWFKNPKGSITGAMGASPGSHVEMAEIENVVPYPVRPDDGLVLNGGDLLLPPMRVPMRDEALSVAMRVKFMAAPLDNSCLFHMGDGEDNMFRLKFQSVLTFQATPTSAGGGMSKLATTPWRRLRHPSSSAASTPSPPSWATMGTCTCSSTATRWRRGHGMVNELNGFIRDVTLDPRKDNYVGTCYMEPSAPLTAGIVALDVFDGELNDLDVTMVSGKFSADKNFVDDPSVEQRR